MDRDQASKQLLIDQGNADPTNDEISQLTSSVLITWIVGSFSSMLVACKLCCFFIGFI